MKLLTAKAIKKVVIGIVLSDGHIDMDRQRFDLYTKEEDYAKYVHGVLSQITGMHVSIKVRHDRRGYTGYRVWTRKHAYWKNMGDKFYTGRKGLNRYIAKRIDAEALAHIWMCDGYLEHSKNRKLDKVQNVGWLCLESFPKDELELLQEQLVSLGVKSSLIKKPWGFGYRIRVGGEALQVFMSMVYPYILDCFSYKTPLFYKRKESADMSLSNAEQYIFEYKCIEDIVRHPLKKGQQ
jgi:hypothetical protein